MGPAGSTFFGFARSHLLKDEVRPFMYGILVAFVTLGKLSMGGTPEARAGAYSAPPGSARRRLSPTADCRDEHAKLVRRSISRLIDHSADWPCRLAPRRVQVPQPAQAPLSAPLANVRWQHGGVRDGRRPARGGVASRACLPSAEVAQVCIWHRAVRAAGVQH